MGKPKNRDGSWTDSNGIVHMPYKKRNMFQQAGDRLTGDWNRFTDSGRRNFKGDAKQITNMATAIGSYVPNPYIRIPSAIINAGIDAYDYITSGRETSDAINAAAGVAKVSGAGNLQNFVPSKYKPFFWMGDKALDIIGTVDTFDDLAGETGATNRLLGDPIGKWQKGVEEKKHIQGTTPFSNQKAYGGNLFAPGGNMTTNQYSTPWGQWRAINNRPDEMKWEQNIAYAKQQGWNPDNLNFDYQKSDNGWNFTGKDNVGSNLKGNIVSGAIDSVVPGLAHTIAGFSGAKEDSPIYMTGSAGTLGIEGSMRLLAMNNKLDDGGEWGEHDFTSSSKGALLQNINTWDPLQGNRKYGLGESFLAGAGQGALNGGAISPGWGHLIGAAAGGLSSLGAASIGRKKFDQRSNAYINQSLNSIRNQNSLLNQNDISYTMANYAAYGGGLNGINNTNLIQNILATNGNQLRTPNGYAIGGQLSGYGADISNDINIFNAGGTHETNPLGGIPQGVDDEGNPNFVEENEVKWNDYIFSDRLIVPDTVEAIFLSKYLKGKSFANAAFKLIDESKERELDPISRRGRDMSLGKLAALQEQVKQQQQQAENIFNLGGMLGTTNIIGSSVNGISTRNANIFAPGGDLNNNDGTLTYNDYAAYHKSKTGKNPGLTSFTKNNNYFIDFLKENFGKNILDKLFNEGLDKDEQGWFNVITKGNWINATAINKILSKVYRIKSSEQKTSDPLSMQWTKVPDIELPEVTVTATKPQNKSSVSNTQNDNITPVSTQMQQSQQTPIVEQPNTTQISPEQTSQTQTQTINKTTNDKFLNSKWAKDLADAYKKADPSLDMQAIQNLVIQDGIESGWGKSGTQAYNNNNWGNIAESDKIWADGVTPQYKSGKDKDADGNPIGQKFRVYSNNDDYVKDRLAHLKRKYDFDGAENPEQFVDKLLGGNKGKFKYAQSKTYRDDFLSATKKYGHPYFIESMEASKISSNNINIKQNYTTKSRGDYKENPKGIIIHHTGGGTQEGALAQLKKDGNSYNFIIDKDGTITQLLPDGKWGYHAGDSHGEFEREFGGINSVFEGISLVAEDDKHVTQQQRAAIQQLIQQRADKWGWDPYNLLVFGHGEISGNKQSDEGSTAKYIRENGLNWDVNQVDWDGNRRYIKQLWRDPQPYTKSSEAQKVQKERLSALPEVRPWMLQAQNQALQSTQNSENPVSPVNPQIQQSPNSVNPKPLYSPNSIYEQNHLSAPQGTQPISNEELTSRYPNGIFKYNEDGTKKTPEQYAEELDELRSKNNKNNQNQTGTVEDYINNLSGGDNMMRYAPMFTNLGLLAKTWAEPVDRLNLGRIQPQMIHDSLPYNPVDSEYVLNKINQDAAATRRGIIDTSGGNRNIAQAGLLAVNRNSQDAIGQAVFQGNEYNRNMLNQSRQFNAGINQFNAQQDAAAQQYNMNAFNQEQQYRKQAEAMKTSMINNYIAGLGTYAGQIGTENRWFDIAPKMYGYDSRANFANTFPGKKKFKYGGELQVNKIYKHKIK